MPVLCWLWFQSMSPVSTETRPTTHLWNIHSGNALVFSINKHVKSTIPLSLYTNLRLGLWNVKRKILLTGHINEIKTDVSELWPLAGYPSMQNERSAQSRFKTEILSAVKMFINKGCSYQLPVIYPNYGHSFPWPQQRPSWHRSQSLAMCLLADPSQRQEQLKEEWF